ncbi:MAG: hypothetical protein HY401_01690 [Elusimicrobia bacterium]|nr:hypothetical protein [Elusimicrobiota bacterium]
MKNNPLILGLKIPVIFVLGIIAHLFFCNSLQSYEFKESFGRSNFIFDHQVVEGIPDRPIPKGFGTAIDRIYWVRTGIVSPPVPQTSKDFVNYFNGQNLVAKERWERVDRVRIENKQLYLGSERLTGFVAGYLGGAVLGSVAGTTVAALVVKKVSLKWSVALAIFPAIVITMGGALFGAYYFENKAKTKLGGRDYYYEPNREVREIPVPIQVRN